MKIQLPLCIFATILVHTSYSHSVASTTQNSLVDELDTDKFEDSGDEGSRVRRSGLTGLINKKLHFIGHLSGASSGSSSHSSSGHHDEHHHGYEGEHHEYGPLPGFEHHDEHRGHKSYDYKKHVLAALFQAVKAITGGVVALKGQVLKIGGYLFTWKGKFLVKKGDQISELGREVAAKALAPPVHHHVVYSAPTSFGSSAYASAQSSHSSSHANEAYHHHGGGHHFVAPSYSAPSPTYSAPSGAGAGAYPYPPSSAPEYDYGNGYGAKVTRAASSGGSMQSGKSQNSLSDEQLHAGLLILKPIQVPKDQHSKYQYVQQSLLKQAASAGLSNGLNYNSAGSYSPSQTSYHGQSSYQAINGPSSNYQSSNAYQGLNSLQQPSGYQGLSSYDAQNNVATSQFIKLPTAFGNDAYRNSFSGLAPTPLTSDSKKIPQNLPQESSPFDFLYKNQQQRSSDERKDSNPAESEQISETALSALNILYQQTGAQNKELNRDTRHTTEDKLTEESLKKILDALFSGKDVKSKGGAPGSGSVTTDMDHAGSENVETVQKFADKSIQRRSDDNHGPEVYPVFEVDYAI